MSILLLRKIDVKKLFLAIGTISAGYEILLYLYPTPETLIVSGLLIGLAAGSFWSMTFLMVCEIIDAHKVQTTEAFSKYNVITTIMGAVTPLLAGYTVYQFGYGVWLMTALVFLIAATIFMYFLKDPVYYKTYGRYPIKEDLSKVIKNKYSFMTFMLTMLLSTLTISTWGSLSRVFFVNVGIRDYWLGIMALVTSIVTVAVYYVLARRRVSTRKVLATLGIVVFGIELLLITFTSDPVIVFILEGIVGTAGVAAIGFSTQNILKNTFRERVYIGRPLFALGMHVANSVWFAMCGMIISFYGGYAAVGSILGVQVDQFGLRVLLIILAVIVFLWAIMMWKHEKEMVKEPESSAIS